MIEQLDVEKAIRNIDERTTRIEQILPTLATKDDLKAFATKDDLKAFATKDDLKAFATKDEVKAEGELTRRHFDVVAERLEDSIRLIADGHAELDKRVSRLERRSKLR